MDADIVKVKLSDLGERLKRLRISRGETQARFSARLGVSIPTFRAMETGDVKVGIGRWADALWLLDRLDDLDQVLASKADLFDQWEKSTKKVRQRAYAPRKKPGR
ncbi:MAG: helix-turn-helix domain-containing protein [Desulfobacterales bacterium]|nr:helix-turn-helix domain-containing protein [Desulfobacterales bacterium]